MRYLLLFLFLFFSFFAKSQSQFIEYSLLSLKRDSLLNAISLYKSKSLQNDLLKLNKKISKVEKQINYKKLIQKIETDYNLIDSLNNIGEFKQKDGGLINIYNLYVYNVKSSKIDYVKLFVLLSKIYRYKNNNDSANFFYVLSLKNGNTNITDFIGSASKFGDKLKNLNIA